MRKRRIPFDRPLRRRRFGPLAIIGSVVALAVVLLAGAAIVLWPRLITHAAGTAQEPNADCTLIVPANPLTARGLATPYQLVATDPNNGPCNEANPAQSAFVQASIFDFDTGQIWVYNPLVIDQGTKPAINPVVPTIPRGAVVAIWFGFNGDNLTLQSAPNTNSLRDGRCVNGLPGSIFGQFAYCNASLFFAETNQAITWNHLKPPALGLAQDGKPCPSTRDFGLVDQDQSDNVTTAYLVLPNGQTAQLTAANQNRLPNAQVLTNGSDNGLLDKFVDPALGCTPWMAPDLANPGHMTTALPLNEMQAMVFQKAPIALIPLNDPMSMDGNNFSLNKTNAYRAGVDQPPARSNAQADPKAYCQNLANTGAPRIVLDAPLTVKMTTPDPGTGDTLFTFLAQRFVNSYMILNCQQLLGKPSPIATAQDANGAAISATFNGQPINTGTNPGPGPAPAPNCTMNGQQVNGCSGSANVNGQNCTFTFANNTVTIECKPQN
jgi:hypothetical protein